MTFREFKDSVKQNKLHFVSGKSVKVKGMGLLQEPHYVLETSGTLNRKVFIHSLSSIEQACAAFFETFKMSDKDRWGVCLSTSHVAGFSILARSFFGGLSEPLMFEWTQEKIVSNLKDNKITVLSLVPTQIYDLVKMSIAPPESLRMVFVGGAKLSKDLREAAVRLGWPLVDCYGSTETFAQMAYSLKGDRLKLFSSWSIKLEDDEVYLKGPGLYTGTVEDSIYKSRREDWFKTGDAGTFEGGLLQVHGKKTGLVKVKGSYLDFNSLKMKFQSFLNLNDFDPRKYFLVCLSEKRSGAGIYLIATEKNACEKILKNFEDLRGVFHLAAVERSELGKVKASSLSNVLKKTVLSL